jgi:TRAP-type C4-dicarboxylate transport system permease small subunit
MDAVTPGLQSLRATQSETGLIARGLGLVNGVVVTLSSIALVVASGVLTYSVISRYFLHLSTDWQDELSVFLIVGAVFMSSAAVQAQRGHVGIEAIASLLPPRANHIRQLLVDIATFVFCAFFAWKSWTLLAEAWVEDYHSSSTWAPPLWIPYSLMTAGMALLSLQVLLQVLMGLRRPR